MAEYPIPARELASYIMTRMPRRKMSLGALTGAMVQVNATLLLQRGAWVFVEPITVVGGQYRIATITPDWYRRERRRVLATDRAMRGLCRRVTAWAIREAGKRNAKARLVKTNIPGGWSRRDAIAQSYGMAIAGLVLRRRQPWFGEMLPKQGQP